MHICEKLSKAGLDSKLLFGKVVMADVEEELREISSDWDIAYLDNDSEEYRYRIELTKDQLVLKCCIPENYPDNQPLLEFKENCRISTTPEMERSILFKVDQLTSSKLGRPMLREIMDVIWNCTKPTSIEQKDIQRQEDQLLQNPGKKKKKKTKYNLAIKFGGLAPDIPLQTTSMQRKSTQTESHNSRKPYDSSSNQTSQRKKNQKLPSMKTAKDVINRLKWDEKLKNENFFIGYEDRFRGIIEVPVWDLNWEDDIAATGPTDKLAIPEHRIQHFKWNSLLVWEKITRTDYMFGSTGSKIDIMEFIKRHESKKEQERNNAVVIKAENVDPNSLCDELRTSETNNDVIPHQSQDNTSNVGSGNVLSPGTAILGLQKSESQEETKEDLSVEFEALSIDNDARQVDENDVHTINSGTSSQNRNQTMTESQHENQSSVTALHGDLDRNDHRTPVSSLPVVEIVENLNGFSLQDKSIVCMVSRKSEGTESQFKTGEAVKMEDTLPSVTTTGGSAKDMSVPMKNIGEQENTNDVHVEQQPVSETKDDDWGHTDENRVTSGWSAANDLPTEDQTTDVVKEDIGVSCPKQSTKKNYRHKDWHPYDDSPKEQRMGRKSWRKDHRDSSSDRNRASDRTYEDESVGKPLMNRYCIAVDIKGNEARVLSGLQKHIFHKWKSNNKPIMERYLHINVATVIIENDAEREHLHKMLFDTCKETRPFLSSMQSVMLQGREIVATVLGDEFDTFSKKLSERFCSKPFNFAPHVRLMRVRGDISGMESQQFPSRDLKFLIRSLYLWNIDGPDNQEVKYIVLGENTDKSFEEKSHLHNMASYPSVNVMLFIADYQACLASRQNRNADRHEYRKDAKWEVIVSKKLSGILRHNNLNFSIDSEGYLEVNLILSHQFFRQHYVTESDIERIVETNSKKRFALQGEHGNYKIRATQGHTVKEVDLDLHPIEDPEKFPNVIHGTTINFWTAISDEGLKRMKRNHIHMTTGLPREESVISGMRNSSNCFIYVDMKKAMADGIAFFLSENGVILSEGNDGVLLPKYFKKVVHRVHGIGEIVPLLTDKEISLKPQKSPKTDRGKRDQNSENHVR